MLSDAQKGGYAVGAFNVENMEMAKAVIAAAEEMRSPVMLQTTPSTVKYGSLETFAAIVKAEASKTDIPVCLHLDHGNSFELVVQAMKAGYTSVMIDGSHETFEKNVALTKKVVEVARAYGVPVEAELGKVGGKEDDLEAEADHNTDPAQAKEFVERTGVFLLWRSQSVQLMDFMRGLQCWIKKGFQIVKRLFLYHWYFTVQVDSAKKMW